MSDRTAGPLLLFDGDCALCVRSVRFVLRHESAASPRSLRFASLGGATGTAIRREFPALERIDSVVWSNGPELLTRSSAVLAVLRYLGGPWRLLAALGSIIPTVLCDRAYDMVARSRRRWFGSACLVPSAEERERFLP